MEPLPGVAVGPRTRIVWERAFGEIWGGPRAKHWQWLLNNRELRGTGLLYFFYLSSNDPGCVTVPAPLLAADLKLNHSGPHK